MRERLLDVLGRTRLVQRIVDPERPRQGVYPPAQHGVDPGRADAYPRGVCQHEHVVAALKGAIQVREQGALARPGRTGDAHAPGLPGGGVPGGGRQGQVRQFRRDALPADKAARTVLDELLERPELVALPRPRCIAEKLLGLPLEVAPQVGQHLAAPFVQARHSPGPGVPVGPVRANAAGQLAGEPRLEGLQPGRVVSHVRVQTAGVAVLGGDIGRHPVVRKLPAEVEPASVSLVGAVQHAVEDFEFRNALARKVGVEPRLLRRGPHTVRRRDPAVAIAQQADQERAASLDLAEAHLQHEQFPLGLVAPCCRLDAPTQVDRLEVMEPRAQPLGQNREHVRAEVVPLGVHVAERTGDKDRPIIPRSHVRQGRSPCLSEG